MASLEQLRQRLLASPSPVLAQQACVGIFTLVGAARQGHGQLASSPDVRVSVEACLTHACKVRSQAAVPALATGCSSRSSTRRGRTQVCGLAHTRAAARALPQGVVSEAVDRLCELVEAGAWAHQGAHATLQPLPPSPITRMHALPCLHVPPAPQACWTRQAAPTCCWAACPKAARTAACWRTACAGCKCTPLGRRPCAAAMWGLAL